MVGTENDLPYDLIASVLGKEFTIGQTPMQRDPGSEIVIIAPPVETPIDLTSIRTCTDASNVARFVGGRGLSPLECLGFDEGLLWKSGATATKDGRVVVPNKFPYTDVLYRAAVLNAINHADSVEVRCAPSSCTLDNHDR